MKDELQKELRDCALNYLSRQKSEVGDCDQFLRNILSFTATWIVGIYENGRFMDGREKPPFEEELDLACDTLRRASRLFYADCKENEAKVTRQ